VSAIVPVNYKNVNFKEKDFYLRKAKEVGHKSYETIWKLMHKLLRKMGLR